MESQLLILSFRLLWVLCFGVLPVMSSWLLETLGYLGLVPSDTGMIAEQQMKFRELMCFIPLIYQNEFH